METLDFPTFAVGSPSSSSSRHTIEAVSAQLQNHQSAGTSSAWPRSKTVTKGAAPSAAPSSDSPPWTAASQAAGCCPSHFSSAACASGRSAARSPLRQSTYLRLPTTCHSRQRTPLQCSLVTDPGGSSSRKALAPGRSRPPRWHRAGGLQPVQRKRRRASRQQRATMGGGRPAQYSQSCQSLTLWKTIPSAASDARTGAQGATVMSSPPKLAATASRSPTTASSHGAGRRRVTSGSTHGASWSVLLRPDAGSCVATAVPSMCGSSGCFTSSQPTPGRAKETGASKLWDQSSQATSKCWRASPASASVSGSISSLDRSMNQAPRTWCPSTAWRRRSNFGSARPSPDWSRSSCWTAWNMKEQLLTCLKFKLPQSTTNTRSPTIFRLLPPW
mmetsp:Transcript_85745/g.255610  ORF Transcript_85745/g.255610 Transcript_85745/m.255610 type:complete len:388 (-) Transcript_85745:628-1791(-)